MYQKYTVVCKCGLTYRLYVRYKHKLRIDQHYYCYYYCTGYRRSRYRVSQCQHPDISRISVLRPYRYGLKPRRLGSMGIWDPRQQGMPRLGSWDPREPGIPGVPGNESQTRFRENEFLEFQTGVWDGDDDENWDRKSRRLTAQKIRNKTNRRPDSW